MLLLLKLCGYFLIMCCAGCAYCQAYQQEDYYTAAIVEYLPILSSSLTNEQKLLANVAEYGKVVAQIQNVIDIIVFPESTLTYGTRGTNAYIETSTEIPKGEENIVPCDLTGQDYPQFFRELSCIARNSSAYLVINLVEREKCTEETQNAIGDTRPCANHGYNLYNANVVFARNGSVISKYRKYNLFGEFSKNKTLTPEVVTFDTDFNVTFGTFICFDLTFEIPALTLVRQGVKNYVYNAMWISELPFLTALQTQQMWAHSNDVTLLASGASLPWSGGGGSGIFQGVNGPLVYDYIEEGGTKVYISKVGKTPDIPVFNDNDTINNINIIDDDAGKAMDNFYMLRDFVDDYTTLPLNTTTGSIYEELCHESDDGNKLCCQFTVETTSEALDNSFNFYSYRFAAFTGVRTYSGVWNGGVELCGIMACLNSTQASCGRRFANYSTVVWPVTFNYIKIQANFTNIHTRMQYPNSVLSSIRPVFPNATTWTSKLFEDENIVERTIQLTHPQSRLLSFAIYGRDFARDSDPFAPTADNITGEASQLKMLMYLTLFVTALNVLLFH